MEEIKLINELIKNLFTKASYLLFGFSFIFIVISFILTTVSKGGERYYLNRFDKLCLIGIFISLYTGILISIL